MVVWRGGVEGRCGGRCEGEVWREGVRGKGVEGKKGILNKSIQFLHTYQQGDSPP